MTDGKLIKSELPPIPEEHEFNEGDLVEMPLWGGKKITGTVKFIDITFENKRYKGLVVLGEDRRYYEFHPEIANKKTK